MMALLIKNTALCLALMIGISALSTCSQPAYASPTGPHGQSGLVTRSNLGTCAAFLAAFLCASFGHARVMARLEGDAFARAGSLGYRFTNPLQSCHPHLVMNGKTSTNLGVHHD